MKETAKNHNIDYNTIFVQIQSTLLKMAVKYALSMNRGKSENFYSKTGANSFEDFPNLFESAVSIL